jgi:hypothetical protein
MRQHSSRYYGGDSWCRRWPWGSASTLTAASCRRTAARPWQTYSGLICMALVLTSCVSWQAQYLKVAAHHASQVEVENHLGRPHSIWELHTGETLWTYRSGLPSGPNTSGITVVGLGWVVGRRSDCSEYVLLFDQQQILRAWLQQPCRADRSDIRNGV